MPIVAEISYSRDKGLITGADYSLKGFDALEKAFRAMSPLTFYSAEFLILQFLPFLGDNKMLTYKCRGDMLVKVFLALSNNMSRRFTR